MRSLRKQRLILPWLQLRMVWRFLGLSALALSLQFLLLAASLANLAADLPQDGPLMMQELPGRLIWILGLSFVICLPLIFCVGVLLTFRIAGPLYRFEQYLKAIQRGEQPADCRIRADDELQEFCTLLNDTTRPLRARAAQPQAAAQPEASGGELERAA